MVLSPAFEQALEQEIESRVNERITKVLEVISKNYRIKYERLLGDLALIERGGPTSMCCGVTKSGKRCNRAGAYSGYCKNHVSQKPEVRVTRSTGSPKKHEQKQHTHTLPPLFMKGCPACECSNNKSLS